MQILQAAQQGKCLVHNKPFLISAEPDVFHNRLQINA
jgi:hypothetical protein